MKHFNERFINANSKKLCELTVAAEMLQLSPLADLTSNSLKKFIERSTDEEIRQTFGLPDDITEVSCFCNFLYVWHVISCCYQRIVHFIGI